jgi:hypothetical protein
MIFVKAAKEKLAQEKDAFMRQNASMSRGGSRRGGNRDVSDAPHPDGWSVAGQGAARPQPKAGDLSQFGKINKSRQCLSPQLVFLITRRVTPRAAIRQCHEQRQVRICSRCSRVRTLSWILPHQRAAALLVVNPVWISASAVLPSPYRSGESSSYYRELGL